MRPGSYAYAEIYEVKMSETSFLKKVDRFKILNPQYNLPIGVDLHDGQRDSTDLWHNLYFFYPEEKQIVKSWTRPIDRGKINFAFVAVKCDFETSGIWKFINKDFSRAENRAQKRKFEERILNVILKTERTQRVVSD